MIYGLYAIKDAKTSFLPLTLDVNDASAIRNFEHAVRRPDSLFRSHPNDYCLCKVGDYDLDTGVVHPHLPEQLVDASACLREV